MGILKILGVLIILMWLVAWMALKVTTGLVHLLVVVGIVLLVMGFMKR